MARILFGDDDREQLRVFQVLLESEGHEVSIASSPSQVLGHLAEGPPDLLILDLRFPNYKDGLCLVRQLRESGCSKPIILLSGWPDEIQGAPEKALVDRLMTKPAKLPDLLQAIADLTA